MRYKFPPYAGMTGAGTFYGFIKCYANINEGFYCSLTFCFGFFPLTTSQTPSPMHLTMSTA